MTMKKFNKTLTFGQAKSGEWRDSSQQSAGANGPVGQTAKTSDSDTQQYSKAAGPQRTMRPLDSAIPMDYSNGLTGIFVPIRNDFSVLDIDATRHFNNGHAPDCPARYCDEPSWPSGAQEKVKRVRFAVCILALLGLALGLMSRLILNVSIVEMIKKPEATSAEQLLHDLSQPPQHLDELLIAAEEGLANERDSQTGAQPEEAGPPRPDVSPSGQAGGADHDDGDDLHFAWTRQEVNIVLGAFYMGYGPGILFSGSVAERYGAKYPLFFCVFGSALINIFTPLIARFSLNLLIGSRVMLGLIQGSLLPCLYELFNRWLTQTESSIFAPMIKVSMPMGSLIGTIMPGILASFKLEWPVLFYIGGLMCLVWSALWVMFATSFPQTNRFVGIAELNRIMRKKKQKSGGQVATITEKPALKSLAIREPKKSPPGGARGTPWLLIVTSPSVLALTTVKFTYNIGMDFIFLQVAVYLREVHQAPIETISAIASSGYCMQMLLISFVGWLAKVVIIRRACGLSVTKWRKVFQGSSNFVMALTYVALAYSRPGVEAATALLMTVCFWWMMGAGGESMLPYDLSADYPASIVGFAHSISIFSGLALSAMCDMILGEHTEDPQKWSTLFYLLAGLLAGGGLVFVLFVKAKPFLPGEKVPSETRRALKQQQVATISAASPAFGTNKLTR